MSDSNQEKYPLILFSGGLDSSFLLAKQLRYSTCDVLTVKSINLSEKQEEAEEIAREKILNYLDTIADISKVRKKFEINIDIGGKNIYALDLLTFQQVPLWFFSAICAADARYHSEVQIGYINGDDIAYEARYISEAWEKLWLAIKPGDVVPLTFPLLKSHYGKEKIVDSFENESIFSPILDLVHYCEKEGVEEEKIDKVCNECKSCKRVDQFDFHKRRPVAVSDAKLLISQSKN